MCSQRKIVCTTKVTFCFLWYRNMIHFQWSRFFVFNINQCIRFFLSDMFAHFLQSIIIYRWVVASYVFHLFLILTLSWSQYGNSTTDNKLFFFKKYRDKHCVKRVCILGFSSPYFPAFGLNTNQKNFEYGYLSRSKTNIHS